MAICVGHARHAEAHDAQTGMHVQHSFLPCRTIKHAAEGCGRWVDAGCCRVTAHDFDAGRSRTKRTGLVRIDIASFQPRRTMATMAHRGGSLLLAALLAS